MDYRSKIITDIELHAVDGIRDCFENGVHPDDMVNGKPLIDELLTIYTRGTRFKQCVKTFVEYGLTFDDKALLAVLLDDAQSLHELLRQESAILKKQYSLQCAYTPLFQSSLLHICAEYSHTACAKVLISFGMDVNIQAGVDEYGFGGQTPIFHLVNQHTAESIEMLQQLIARGADLALTVRGLLWGKGYSWETFIPAVNTISYAMMGLLRQFQRTEQEVYTIVALLIKAQYGIDYSPTNIPNLYLNT